MRKKVAFISQNNTEEEQLAKDTAHQLRNDWDISLLTSKDSLLDEIRSSFEDKDAFIFFSQSVLTSVSENMEDLKKSYLFSIHEQEGQLLPSTKQISGTFGVELPSELDPSKKKELIQKHSWIKESPYFVYMGGANSCKAFDELNEAFCYLRKDYNLPARLVYSSPEAGNVKLPEENADFIGIGKLLKSEKSYVLKNSAALIYPQAFMGVSLGVLEAWKHEVPVIVNGYCKAMRQLCDKTGGGLCYHSVPMLKGLMAWAYHHPTERHTLAKRGREYVDKHYNWKLAKEILLREVQ